jgi:hypothetical protein
MQEDKTDNRKTRNLNRTHSEKRISKNKDKYKNRHLEKRFGRKI